MNEFNNVTQNAAQNPESFSTYVATIIAQADKPQPYDRHKTNPDDHNKLRLHDYKNLLGDLIKDPSALTDDKVLEMSQNLLTKFQHKKTFVGKENLRVNMIRTFYILLHGYEQSLADKPDGAGNSGMSEPLNKAQDILYGIITSGPQGANHAFDGCSVG